MLSPVVAAGLAGAGGVVAGRAGRWALRRVRRGVRVRAGWVEAGVGAAWGVTALRVVSGGVPGWWAAVPVVLGWFGVVLSAADLARSRLPNALTLAAYPAFAMALLPAAVVEPGLAGRAVLGLVLFGGAHLVVRAVAPSALGGGDVKLAGSLGLVLGALGWSALLVGPLLAAVGTAVLLVTRRAPGGGVPHGPGLVFGVWALAVWGGGGGTPVTSVGG